MINRFKDRDGPDNTNTGEYSDKTFDIFQYFQKIFPKFLHKILKIVAKTWLKSGIEN